MDFLLSVYIEIGYCSVAINFKKTAESEDNKKQVNHGGI